MRVLILGGTGFFGRAFARYIVGHGHTACIYSRNEYSQFLMRQEMCNDENLRWFIGDVRDKKRLQRAMNGCDVVINAAALKRIEVGFYDPGEMVKTNVHGAMNVIEAAVDANVHKVIFLSSDKAWQPISPYGQSKALAENLFLAANYNNGANGPIFAVTRYGNVANSTGSVIPIWRREIADGQTQVRVTDPECTRFWMTEDQAVELVYNTMNTMSGGETIVPENLPAYRLGDLAEAMGVSMKVVGLGNFEKLHEGMCDGMTSDKARRMTVGEIREALKTI